MQATRRKTRARRRTRPLAVLDLGTNNCRLLIAVPAGNGTFRVVDSFSRIVRLGEGVAVSGELSPAAIDRTLAALKICAARIAWAGAVQVSAIATQACRRARNADLLLARAEKEAGIALTIVTAEEEARLAALGCEPLVGRRYKGALVFDIGGGSTEIIVLARRDGRIETLHAASVPVGVVSLAEEYGAAARTRAGFETMRARLKDRFAGLPGHAPVLAADSASFHLLGTSGTVTTLAAIALGLPRYNRARVDASWHKTAAMLAIVEKLADLDPGGLAAIGGIGRERADLMLPGCALFGAICAHWPFAELRVADRGLREGMLRDLLARPS